MYTLSAWSTVHTPLRFCKKRKLCCGQQRSEPGDPGTGSVGFSFATATGTDSLGATGSGAKGISDPYMSTNWRIAASCCFCVSEHCCREPENLSGVSCSRLAAMDLRTSNKALSLWPGSCSSPSSGTFWSSFCTDASQTCPARSDFANRDMLALEQGTSWRERCLVRERLVSAIRTVTTQPRHPPLHCRFPFPCPRAPGFPSGRLQWHRFRKRRPVG